MYARPCRQPDDDPPEVAFSSTEAVDQLRLAVDYAILAPSSHNSQPWLFSIRGDELELRADRTRALPVIDPHDRELLISCGAALFNLRVALLSHGHECQVALLPDVADEDLLARVALGAHHTPTEEDMRLFHAITRRHTNRHPFEARPVPAELVGSLERAAAAEGTWLKVLEGEEKERMGLLIGEADRAQFADASFRRELASWIGPRRTRRHEGIPGEALGLGTLTARLGPLVLRTFDRGDAQAARDSELALGSPLLVVLGTELDAAPDWLRAGQALERVLLTARAADLWASFLNQPVEVAETRRRLRDVAGIAGTAQLVLRLGYGPDVPATPRRPVGEVLMGG